MPAVSGKHPRDKHANADEAALLMTDTNIRHFYSHSFPAIDGLLDYSAL